MDLLLLIIVNIVLATIFYLIMRLRLERSVHTYQEKKLLKIMDEVIREFDSTAERNISILENRISIMKRLLTEAGRIKPIDLNIGEFEGQGSFINMTSSIDQKASDAGAVDCNNDPNCGLNFDKMSEAVSQKNISVKPAALHNSNGIIKKNMSNYFSKLRECVKPNHKLNIKNQDMPGFPNQSDLYENCNSDISKELDATTLGNVSLRKDVVEDHDKDVIPEENFLYTDLTDGDVNLSEEDLSKLFIASTDKYSLINELYGNGFSIDIISRCSGIPVGEVKLVLDLNVTI